MNMQSTEPTGERFSTSPELGFAFERIPLDTMTHFLKSSEFRRDSEAEDISLYLRIIRNYFAKDAHASYWFAYIDAHKQASEALRYNWLPKDVINKYTEISDMLKVHYFELIEGEVESINLLLNQYPGIVTKDVDGSQYLVGVATIVEETGAQVHPTPPIHKTALWSGAEATESVRADDKLYVDITVLPERFSERFKEYHPLNSSNPHQVN